MLDSVIGSGLTVYTFLICTAVSLILGIATALLAHYRSRSTAGFGVMLAVLPAVVQLVIMLVNGNVGAGVAVAGAFGLVRFRSAPGTAKEIGVIFLAMALGLATGMGYLLLAAGFFVIVAAAFLLLTRLDFCGGAPAERILKITIPENLDYEALFDDLFEQYTSAHTLEKVKTSNMGTLYELQYRIKLKTAGIPKEFLDAIRCRNGNLNIVCGREETQELF